MDSPLGDAKGFYRPVHRVSAIVPPQPIGPQPRLFDVGPAPFLPQVPDVFCLKGPAIGRQIAFLIQGRRNLSVVIPLGIELANPVLDLLAIDMIAVAHALQHDLMCTPGPRLPVDLKPDLAVHAFPIPDDVSDNQTQQTFPIGMRGGGGMPEAGEVFANRENLLTLLRGHLRVTLALPRLVLLLGSLNLAQLRFPLTLQRARHEP